MEQTVTVRDLDALADAFHRIGDLVACGRAVVLADHWNISAYDYLHLAEDIVDAMTVHETHDWIGELDTMAGRRCRLVVGRLAGHPVRLAYTTDDLDWHGPKVGEVA